MMLILIWIDYSYFFIFSLATRELLQHIYIPHTPNTRNSIIVSCLNATHVLIVDKIWNGTQCKDKSESPATYRLNIYSLDGKPQSKSPEIVITDPFITEGVLPQDINDGRNEGFFSNPLDPVAFDHLGREWFPYKNCSTITTTHKDDPDNNRFIHADELPRSRCSQWVILDSSSVTEIKEYTPSTPAPITYNNSIETIFCNFQHSLFMLDLIFQTDTLEPGAKPSAVRIQKSIPTRHAFPIPESTTITLRVPQNVSEQFWWSPSRFGRARLEEIDAVWGYMVNEGEVRPETLLANVYLMPFHEDDAENGLQMGNHSGEETTCTAGGWKCVRNGLPPDFCAEWERIVAHRYLRHGWFIPRRYALGIDIYRAWGDDGVICWEPARRLKPGDEVSSWVVCYDENWGAQASQ